MEPWQSISMSQNQTPQIQKDCYHHACSQAVHERLANRPVFRLSDTKKHWETDVKVDSIEYRPFGEHAERIRICVIRNVAYRPCFHECSNHCQDKDDQSRCCSRSKARAKEQTKQNCCRSVIEHEVAVSDEIQTKRDLIEHHGDRERIRCESRE